jgi:hypothetical protein
VRPLHIRGPCALHRIRDTAPRASLDTPRPASLNGRTRKPARVVRNATGATGLRAWNPPAGDFGPTQTGCGAVAQLGERLVRNEEVGSSILPGSTTRLAARRHIMRRTLSAAMGLKCGVAPDYIRLNSSGLSYRVRDSRVGDVVIR